MSGSYDIHTGAWINHSRGTVLGATLTRTSRDTGFLLAVLVTPVGFAGGSLWTIISYITHQVRSTLKPQRAYSINSKQFSEMFIHRSMLRRAFARLLFAWRKHMQAASYLQGVLFIVTPLVVAAAFAVAGTFTSKLQTAAGTLFLLKGNNCGTWAFLNETSSSGFSVTRMHQLLESDMIL